MMIYFLFTDEERCASHDLAQLRSYQNKERCASRSCSLNTSVYVLGVQRLISHIIEQFTVAVISALPQANVVYNVQSVVHCTVC